MTRITIAPDDAGVRLDRHVRKLLSLQPLSVVYRMIRRGQVRLNGRRADAGRRLAEGDTIEIDIAESELTAARPGARGSIESLADTVFFRKNFRVLHEDDMLLACDKPGRVVVHSGSGHLGHDSIIDMARSYLMRSGAPADPALVHRLDRDTSGVLLIAKSRRALRAVHESFRSGGVTKRYVAICHGVPSPPRGTVRAALATTHEPNAGTKVRVAADGLPSVTDYEVVRAHGALSMVELVLRTGRTHQIRVHMAHKGCPVVGDVRYGDAARDSEIVGKTGAARRLYLHARSITVPHPLTGRPLTVMSPDPPEFQELMEAAAGSGAFGASKFRGLRGQ